MATKPTTLREELALLRRQINEERDAREAAGPSGPREVVPRDVAPSLKAPLRRRRKRRRHG